MVTRSQSQGDKENTMADSLKHDDLNTTMQDEKASNCNNDPLSQENETEPSSDEDIGTKAPRSSYGNYKTRGMRSSKGVKTSRHVNAEQHVDTIKGYVAERVDKINSNPSTPVSVKMPKVKSVSKTRMLILQNGQLGMEGVQGVAAEVSSTLNAMVDSDPADDEEASLTSILKELSITVKKLEKKLEKMDKDRKEIDRKVSTIEIVQQQEVVKLRGAIDQIDDHDEKIQALMGIVVRQDQQIQALTNHVNSAYAAKCHKNLIVNGIPQTQDENCFHEIAHFFKFVLKIASPVPVKYARRIGKVSRNP